MTKTTQKKKLETFFHSKTGKLLPVLLIVLLIGVASSTVYTYYMVSNTATVKTPDLRLVAGTDASASCTSFPCATVTVASTYDYAAVTLSLFPSATNAPQPATYYSNLSTIQNHGTVVHSIKSVELSGFTNVASLGAITVYYCTTQTEFNPDGTLVTPGNCPYSYTITSLSTGVQAMSGAFPASLAAGAKGYIEVAAYALSTATVGTSISFQISIQWL